MPQRDENRKWVCRMKDDLQRSVDGGPRTATIFRVPASVREVSKDSYTPKCLSFGPYNRRNSLLYTIRLDFVRVFQEITRKRWDEIYSTVLEGKSLEKWMNLYDGLKLDHQVEAKEDGENGDGKKKVEENVAKEEKETFLTWDKETGESFLVWDAIFVVCFLLADRHRKCRRLDCPIPPRFLDLLRREIGKQTVAPLVHLIRLDIFKFENQIPLGLVKKVFEMIFNNDQPSTSSSKTGNADTEKLSFVRFVTDSVSSIYCDLPRPELNEFKKILGKPEFKFEERKHLLECLYLVVCYPPENEKKRESKTDPGQEIGVARDVTEPQRDKQPTGVTGKSVTNIGSNGVRTDLPSVSYPKKIWNSLRRLKLPIFGKPARSEDVGVGDVELAHSSNVGGGDDTSGPTQDDTGKSVEGNDGPSQDSNVGGGEGTSGAQDDKGKYVQIDVDPGQIKNGGTTGVHTQADKGESLQIEDNRGQNRRGDGEGGTSGVQGASGAQDDKGKYVQIDVDPGQSKNGGTTGVHTQADKGKSLQIEDNRGQNRQGDDEGGTSGEICPEEGKSPQPGDAGPAQNSNGSRGVETSEAQHDEGKSAKGDTVHRGHSGDKGAARNWFANLLACVLTWIFCEGCWSKDDDQRHNHCQGIPTITKLRASNIAVKVGSGNATNWISEVKFRSSCFFSYEGKLYLPIFAVYDETETLLRNLLVYECVIVPQKRALRSFIHLMSNLVNDEEDVRWMKESGVLKNNTLGRDQEVADMWKTMLSGVVMVHSKHYQFEVFDKIAKHRKKTTPRRLGELKVLYNNRWQFLGILAAFVTIAATILAAFYTIFTYYDGNKQRAQT